ncbi:MAG: glycosyltransferase family 9 protein [Ignavibacteriales bacterium]|nr:glycosyltransferase family 9 protein [Ignavibacteriales bacterium]
MKIRGNSFLKSIDRYIGIPLLFMAAKFRRKKVMPASIKSIAVLLTPAIGDTILLQALLRDIRKCNPEVKITLFCPKAVIETARLMQFSDEIIEIHITRVLKTISVLRKHTFDLLIDAGQWTRLSAFICCFADAGHIRGFETAGQYRHYAFDSTVVHRNDVHEVTNLKRLNWLPVSGAGSLPQITLPKLVKAYPNRIVIHMKPGGAKPHLKEWPIESWNAVVAYLLSREMDIYFTGSFSDYPAIDKFIATFFAGKLVNVAGTLSIADTASLLKSASLVISVNTGIMHLASALGCNLVVLHGPTNYKRWGPLNSNALSLQSPYHQAPCLNLGFEYNCKDRTGECMKAISTASVIKAIEKLIPVKEITRAE